MIRIENLLKRYDGRVVLDIPALTLDPGERVALLGPNGSGKSTLLRILSGVLSPDAGSAIVEPSRAYLPQTPYAFDCSVLQNVLLALPRTPDAARQAQTALSLVGMEGFAAARGNRLSGGERQRMALARVLASPRRLLLLDEPTSSVDVAAEDAIEAALTQYLSDNHAALLLSSHAPAQAKRLCTRVIVLDHGRVVEDGQPASVLRSPQSPEAAAFLRHWRF